jgi:hypothetical protein
VNPGTSEPYTNAEVAHMSAGGLTEEEVQGIRSGAIPDPTVGQVAALAGAFGVEPSYLVDRKEPPSLDAELPEGLRDTTKPARRSACRSEKGRSYSASSGSSGDALSATTKETDAARMPRPLWSLAYVLEKIPN